MAKRKFKVYGQFDKARACPATLTIDTESGTMSVRPHRRRREYTINLSLVAEIVVQKIIIAEVRLAEKNRKPGKRRTDGRKTR